MLASMPSRVNASPWSVPSGCGKSTILNLLLGFEVPSSGAVYVDGQDLAGLDLTAVRRQIGVVRQDSKLMSDSIFANIICGSRSPMKDAWEATGAAGLAEDIEQMPMGMHTVIAEGGSNISGRAEAAPVDCPRSGSEAEDPAVRRSDQRPRQS